MKEIEISENAVFEELPSSKSSITLTIIHNRNKYKQTFDLSTTVGEVKRTMELLTGVPASMQKLIYRSVLVDDIKLENLHFSLHSAKLMLVGTQANEVEHLQNSAALMDNYSNCSANNLTSHGVYGENDDDSDWCDQVEHKNILKRFGMPDNVMVGILNTEECLTPDQCLVGLYDKRGQSLRLKIKSETGELWLVSKTVTNKFPLSIIQDVRNQFIKGHPEYHIMAFQLGPTKKSRYFVYWIPSQYVQSIKTFVLQYKILNSMNSKPQKNI